MYSDKSLHIIGAAGFDGNTSIKVDLWSLKKRLIKGIVSAIIIFSIVALSLLIPIVHFLSPLLFILGIIWIIFDIRKKGIILEGNVICPQCKSVNNLKGILIFSSTYIECKNCHQQLFVEEIKKFS